MCKVGDKTNVILNKDFLPIWCLINRIRKEKGC